MTKSYIVSVIILFCTVLVETAILSNISILPAVPDLLLICTLYLSVLNGKTYGEITGFSSGFFLDLLSGAPFGFNCLSRTLLGYIEGLVGSSFNFDSLLMPAIMGFTCTLLKVIIVFIISLLFPSVTASYHVFSIPFLFELVSNTVLAPALFKFLDLFKSVLSLNPEDKK